MATVPTNLDARVHGPSVEQHRPTSYPVGVPANLNYPNIPAWGILDRAARECTQRVAAEFLGYKFTYGQINSASLDLASWLQRRGVCAGQRIGVLLPNCPEYLIALNAIWRAGGVAVAISPLSVADDVRALLELTQCRTVICLDLLVGLLERTSDDAQSVEQVEQKLLVSLMPYLPAWKRAGYMTVRWRRAGHFFFANNAQQSWLWDAIRETPDAAAGRGLMPVETVPATDPAYIMSTGGTTGNPKAVTLSHRNIVANAWQQMAWAGASMGQETMLAVLPFFHSYGMSTMLGSGPALGATLIMQPRFNPHRAIAAIERHRPTVFHAVPAMLAVMNEQLRKRAADLSSLKWVISGGASLPREIAEEFAAHSGALVVEGYGLSEASPVTHVGPLDGSNVTGTIGLPLPDTQCRIVDAETGQHDLPEGEIGELIVRGPQVMLGYWKNTEATAQAMRDGWLYTGDLACQARGVYRIVDRKKDLIITSGFNVYPADVEQVLKQCEAILDVAVVGVPDAQRGEIVKAFVVLRPGHSWDLRTINKFSHDKLAAHRRPHQWEVVSDLPRNFLGKVSRRELRVPAPSSGGQACTD